MKYTDPAEFEKANRFGTGALNEGYAQYFTGVSYLNFLLKPGEVPVAMANVTFEPGCRNHWHIHHASQGGGQMLICTAGEGWLQFENEAALSLREGSVAYIPAGKKHWHGARADSWFSHVAFELPGSDCRSEWLEPVGDEVYGRLASGDPCGRGR